MVDEKKREKVNKGWLVVQVGTEENDRGLCRFVIPISYLYHPLLKRLLEKKMEPMKAPAAESPPIGRDIGQGNWNWGIGD
ncbi:hypothetical protein V6N13_057270 [Hibiscus sabdariffa]|uniref:Uncharacterized protein n=1 Tax=Hibiscus sabdariffa TaxID=183260 RepID=A0ABR1ZSB9_9ROSI